MNPHSHLLYVLRNIKTFSVSVIQVSTVQVNVRDNNIDLDRLARNTLNTTYDRNKFAAITIRIANPKTTALLFSSGKLVITGGVFSVCCCCFFYCYFCPYSQSERTTTLCFHMAKSASAVS